MTDPVLDSGKELFIRIAPDNENKPSILGTIAKSGTKVWLFLSLRPSSFDHSFL
jgi:hypothetical protein